MQVTAWETGEVALDCLSALQLDAHASVAQRPELSPCKRAVEGSTPSGGSIDELVEWDGSHA